MALISKDLAPISAVLALGSLAGQGQALAAQQAKRIQDVQLAQQQAQQNIQNQMQLDEQNRQIAAQNQSNEIARALEFQKLDQAKQVQQAEMARQTAQDQARNLQQQAELAVSQQRAALDQQKFQTEQMQSASRDADVERMIDQIAPAGSEQNLRMKLQYRATKRLPAAQPQYPARDVNALRLYRESLLDPISKAIGEERALPGREEELNRINQQLSNVAGQIGQDIPEDIMSQISAPAQGQYQVGQVITNPQGRQGKVVSIRPDGSPEIQVLN